MITKTILASRVKGVNVNDSCLSRTGGQQLAFTVAEVGGRGHFNASFHGAVEKSFSLNC